MPKEKVMIICAHPDDEAFGVGGTIAKYVQDSHIVTVVRFSYGERSHVWLKKHITAKMRAKEANNAKKILGYKHSIFLGEDEGKFRENKDTIRKELKKHIKNKKPDKIFTHNMHDPHEDHKAVNNIVMDTVEEINYKGDVYIFDIWNVLNIKRQEYPMLYVDITDTFVKKIEAIKCFKSQWSSIYTLIGFVCARAFMYGFTHNVTFAERFFKVR